MRPAAFHGGRLRHDRRAGQRMAELDAQPQVIDLDEPRSLGGSEPGEECPSPGRVQDMQVTAPLQRGEQERVARIARQAREPGRERQLQSSAKREQRRRPGLAAHAASGQYAGKLQECQRIASRDRQHMPAQVLGEAGEASVKQLDGLLISKRREMVLIEPGTFEESGSGPQRPEQPHAAARQSARDEAENGRACPVQPLQVVHDQQQRPGPRRLAKQRLHGLGDHQPVRRRADAASESGCERARLIAVKDAQRGGLRPQELVQPGVADVRLELNPCRAKNMETGRLRIGRRLVEQRRLPDARLPDNDKRPPWVADRPANDRTVMRSADRPDEPYLALPCAGRAGMTVKRTV